MQRNDIIEELWRSPFINDAIRTITGGNKLGEELKSELFLILMEMPKTRIIQAHKECWLNYLVINILKKQYHSSTSPFHKKFRAFNNEVMTDPQYQELDLSSDEMVAKIEMIVETKLDLVDRELFKMYFKIDRYDRWLGDLRDKTCQKATSSYRKMQRKLQLNEDPRLTISRNTISLSIQRAMVVIKRELEKEKDNE